ncbi:MAG: hypothetical protein K6T65_06200 [Peptococcaceae bacterium]|nr:hypothetical protein [Peptococcaceae bacterium]
MAGLAILLAAVSAAGLAMAVNLLIRKAGQTGIVYLGPAVEEGIKTGAALVFNASLPGAHIMFGILEALADYAWGGQRKILAAVSGVTAHTIFGLVTYFIIRAGYPVYTGVLGSIAVHMAWNTVVLKISK